MLELNTTASELKAELKAVMSQWRKDNPEPKLEIEPRPELPEPLALRFDNALLIIEVRSGESLYLHIVEGNATRKVNLDNKQLGALIQALMDVRRPMKEHRTWKTMYEEELVKHEFLRTAWERQMMAFKESVKRRLGFSVKETEF